MRQTRYTLRTSNPLLGGKNSPIGDSRKPVYRLNNELHPQIHSSPRKAKKIFFDNGKSFVSSCSELKKGIESLRASKEFASKLHFLDTEIEWKYNSPLAPHFGGSWVRLIQMFKLSLCKVIGSRTPADETLYT